MMNNKSPLRYPGGKTRACKYLDNVFIKYFNVSKIKTITSPFFGGGSFEFYLQNKYNFMIEANDKFTPLYHFWNQAKINKIELCDKIEKLMGVSKEQFYTYRSLIMEESSLTQAIYYFIINRCSFSGATLSGGFSKQASINRFTQSSIDRIRKLNLDNINFYNLDFVDFFSKIENNNVMFLDPPYYLEKKSKLYGNNGNLHKSFDHKKLHTLLSTRDRWIMTYNDCDYIRILYKDYIIIDLKWSYGMNKSKNSSEIVIINP